MGVPTVIGDLSETIASNSPAGGDQRTGADDYLRAHAGFIAQLNGSKGYLGIPSVSSTGETAAVAHKGKCLATSGGITIPNATFAAGDTLSIYNNSAASITITQGASLTLRLAGTTGTGNRTLAARGIATVWFVGASEAVINGAGLT